MKAVVMPVVQSVIPILRGGRIVNQRNIPDNINVSAVVWFNFRSHSLVFATYRIY